VDAFYTALQSSRDSIHTYYAPPQSLPDGSTIPDILWNGTPFADGNAVQKMFTDEMPAHLFYDVHAVDCQVLNPRYSTNPKVKADKNFSMLVTTSGHLRLEDRKTGPLKDFSETFVLVPNVEKAVTGAGKGAASRRRDWLIQLQNFRYVVHHHPSLIEGQVAMDVE
jgi:NTF2-related export protein 1/2